MRRDFEKLFSHLEPPEPPEGLFDKIMRRIQKEQQLLTFKRRLAIFSVFLIASIAAFIQTLRLVKTELAESNFIEFFSLLFSDSSSVLAHWQSFVFALLESLPIISIIALLAAIFTLLQSFKFFARDVMVVFYTNNIN